MRPLNLSIPEVKLTRHLFEVAGILNDYGDETYAYTLQFNPLKLTQTVNGIETLTIFDQSSLYVEKTTGLNENICAPPQSIEELLLKSSNLSDDPVDLYPPYAADIDY